MMLSLNQIKQCIENCKIAGDVERDSKEFILAAVMIIFSIDQLKNRNELIIIKKKNNLRKHSGQIAFPGGKKEIFDNNLRITALRETYEEINLKNSDLEILGELPFFYTGTGYKVKPIISKLNDNIFLEEILKPDLDEIEKIFIADAKELLNPINHFRIKAPQNSMMKMTWKVKYKSENIWGLTARLLVTLSAGFNLREYPPCNDI
tara:strand:+ start:658 stop:1275 length:618 start_codon:yes stop_codon:yes gene_type:complete